MRFFKSGRIKKVLLSAVTALITVFASGQAHALLLTESYVFVGPKGGSAIFKMKNTSGKPEAYRMDWVELLMDNEGSKISADETALAAANVKPASPYMYVAPRRLMIQPGQVQNIRFMVRRNNSLTPGEYRSYIAIGPEEIPAEFNPDDERETKDVGGGRSVQISMLTGYRIPVFFLHGETTLEVSFSNVNVTPKETGRYNVSYTINRSGTRSALGQVRIVCDAPDGQLKVIKRVDARVFSEVSTRTYTREFDVPAGGCTNYRIGFYVHDLDPLASRDYLASAPLNIR